jgi:hypothetical protein
MNGKTESFDSVLCEFNDVETPPDLTVRPMPAGVLRPYFRRQVFPEKAFSWRDDLAALSGMVEEEQRACLRANNMTGAAYCVANLAVLAKVKGLISDTHKLASEAEGMALQAGIADLVAQMQALRQMKNGK